MLPDAFKPATWRGTTNTDGQAIGVSFDLPDGSVIRLAIPMRSAWQVANSLTEYCAPHWARMNSHSASSSGNPSVDGSVHCE